MGLHITPGSIPLKSKSAKLRSYIWVSNPNLYPDQTNKIMSIIKEFNHIVDDRGVLSEYTVTIPSTGNIKKIKQMEKLVDEIRYDPLQVGFTADPEKLDPLVAMENFTIQTNAFLPIVKYIYGVDNFYIESVTKYHWIARYTKNGKRFYTKLGSNLDSLIGWSLISPSNLVEFSIMENGMDYNKIGYIANCPRLMRIPRSHVMSGLINEPVSNELEELRNTIMNMEYAGYQSISGTDTTLCFEQIEKWGGTIVKENGDLIVYKSGPDYNIEPRWLAQTCYRVDKLKKKPVVMLYSKIKGLKIIEADTLEMAQGKL